MVSRFAVGKSTAMNSTPASIRLAMKATLRASRSSLAMIRVAPVRRHVGEGLRQLGAVVALAALDLGELGRERPVPPFR